MLSSTGWRMNDSIHARECNALGVPSDNNARTGKGNTNMRNQWIDIVKTAVDLALVTVLLILLWPVLKVLSFLF